MLIFGQFCLTTELDSIVNCRPGYFSSEISGQQIGSGKTIKMYPFVHTKNSLPICIFTVICDHCVHTDSGESQLENLPLRGVKEYAV